MFNWEQARERALRKIAIENPLADEQLDRLSTYRDRLAERAADVELDLDERRLRFVRWLFEHGRIGEEL